MFKRHHIWFPNCSLFSILQQGTTTTTKRETRNMLAKSTYLSGTFTTISRNKLLVFWVGEGCLVLSVGFLSHTMHAQPIQSRRDSNLKHIIRKLHRFSAYFVLFINIIWTYSIFLTGTTGYVILTDGTPWYVYESKNVRAFQMIIKSKLQSSCLHLLWITHAY